jgi:hypothetical protein
VNISKSARWSKRGVAGSLVAVLLIVGVPAAIQITSTDAAGAATLRVPSPATPSFPSTAPSVPSALPTVTPAAPAAPAATCTGDNLCSTSFEGDAADVKTSNGDSWILTVSGSSSQVTVELGRVASTSPVADELHAWTLPVTSSGGLKFSAATGTGTIDPGTQTSPYATVDVTFHSKASKVVAGACTSGSETQYTGTLTGSLKLSTGLTGTIGATSFTAKSSDPTVTVYNNCAAPESCLPSSTGFDEDPSPLANPSLLAEGISGTFSGKTFDEVILANETTLSKPKGAYRIDESFVEAKPATWSAATNTLSVTTGGAGSLITGSVTVSGGEKSSASIPCTQDGKKVDNVFTYYDNASWRSKAGQALTAHNKLGGNLVMPLTNADATILLSSIS